ncbi:GNAT family N-acetyltransferase [uncultured Roseobacter sp.]|uniref:GNAT family N-acetyltransferase n=1 Tax=uncultured Roseobacter sp. TaxID=114847 RepID=UPI00261FCA5E|nr:GNAT family N-acetyltransferase [uncultured Roseobacter sp.]
MAFDVGPTLATQADVAHLLDRHFELMRSQSPPESCHVLPSEALSADDIHLFVLRENGQALAIGAIRTMGDWGELKSMHTASEARGRGAGRTMLAALIDAATGLGLHQLKLETGSGPEHAAARALYLSAGFAECPPFGDYTEDPLSVFMQRTI